MSNTRFTPQDFGKVVSELRWHLDGAGVLAEKIKKGSEPPAKLADAVLGLEQVLRRVDTLLNALADRVEFDS